MTKAEDAGMVMGVQEAAAFLGVSNATVYRYVNLGHLPAFRVGCQWRFRKDQLEAWTKKEATKGMVKALHAAK